MFRRLTAVFEACVQQYRYDHASPAVQKIVDLAKSEKALFRIASDGRVRVVKNPGTPDWKSYNYNSEGKITSRFSRGYRLV